MPVGESSLEMSFKDKRNSPNTNVSPAIKESLDRIAGRSMSWQTDESWQKVYNPQNNTINLAKLTMALQYKNSAGSTANGMTQAIGRARTQSPADESMLNDILNQTLQKLKRRPQKMIARL